MKKNGKEITLKPAMVSGDPSPVTGLNPNFAAINYLWTLRTIFLKQSATPRSSA